MNTEAERRVLAHGVTSGCPLCAAAALRLGLSLPKDAGPVLRRPVPRPAKACPLSDEGKLTDGD
jgi:hypothetical protein